MMLLSTLLVGLVVPTDFMIFQPEKNSQWTVSSSDKIVVQVNPCARDRWDTGRVASKWIHFTDEDYARGEQLVIYKDATTAKKVMREIRADLRRCADTGEGWYRNRHWSKPLALGDEAVMVGSRYFHSGWAEVAVRKGAALMIYGESAWPNRSLSDKHFADVLGWAHDMTAKVCQLPEARCQG
ncbi:hypothetical protein ACIBH1_17115 [Nonomuraea sp. NPDC050663]|uniref:hypothetical protein n=1 Tax=Nonomuraea sp. NPDC050663 TaxID=3364370 RepID=UPI0037AC339D